VLCWLVIAKKRAFAAVRSLIDGSFPTSPPPHPNPHPLIDQITAKAYGAARDTNMTLDEAKWVVGLDWLLGQGLVGVFSCLLSLVGVLERLKGR